jgi:hypothetical protein
MASLSMHLSGLYISEATNTFSGLFYFDAPQTWFQDEKGSLCDFERISSYSLALFTNIVTLFDVLWASFVLMQFMCPWQRYHHRSLNFLHP